MMAGERSGVLRSRGVARLTAILLLSNTAETYALIALLWFVMEETGSPVLMGTVVLCSGLPALITAPVAGRLLDRLSPGPLMAVDNAARAAVLGTVVVLHMTDSLTMPLLLVLVLVNGALSPVTFAGCRVVVPRLVPTRGLLAANGVLSIGDQFPLLVGPATAGPMVAWLGGAMSLTLPVILLLIAGLLLLALPAQAAPAHESGGDGERAGWFGLAPLLRSPALRALLVLSVTYFFAYGPLEAALPIFVRQDLGEGAAVYGLLWTVFGLGALCGLVTVRPLSRMRPGVVNALSTIGWGLVLLPMALIPDTTLACVLMFCGAFVWAPYTAIEISTIQRLVPRHLHGSVLGARRAILVVASPSGAAVGGVLLSGMGSSTVILLSAVACLTAGGVCLATRGIQSVPPVGFKPKPSDSSRPVAALDEK